MSTDAKTVLGLLRTPKSPPGNTAPLTPSGEARKSIDTMAEYLKRVSETADE